MSLHIYLSGEIHSDWRIEVRDALAAEQLDVELSGPVTHHELSDNIGAEILGEESDPFWVDHKSAKINAIRTRTFLEAADVVVVKFGEKYKQWNAAFDAGYAAALGTPLIIMHPPEHRHALKEVDADALAVVETPEQVARIVKYVLKGEL